MRVVTHCLTILMCLAFQSACPAWALDIKAGILRVDYPRLLPISRYDLKAEDLGFAGGVLANEDNATTGAFLGMNFSIENFATSAENAETTLQQMQEEGLDLIIIMAEVEELLRLTDSADTATLLVNATARDISLRDDECRGQLLHVAPSQAMIADAVTQFAMWKQWKRWFLIQGSNSADRALGDAYRLSATKFGAKITEEREFEDTGGSRRTDTGHVLVQRQLPLFTQNAKEHDIVVAADASDVFALHLPFHTWDPRPILGSGGLRPVTFHSAHEAWGATQFQRRFEKLSGRFVQEEDYQVWLSLRVIGEAVIRTNSNNPAVLREYILGDEFELAAFKGRKVTFRPWNGQMRQPIILTDSKVTVSVSPQDGYLHQRTTLDTLGLDQPESSCTAFQ